MPEPAAQLGAPSAYVGRFAPSPTGDLHLGSLVTALAGWLCAAQAGGTWLVRIEDIDPPREVPGASERILQELQRLGLQTSSPILWQSAQHDRYRRALQRLIDAGLAFPCWCSRQEIAARGLHRGVCNRSDASRPPAWRVLVPNQTVTFDDRIHGRQHQDLSGEVGDFVIWRSDDLPAYQLAVVLDDAWQGVTDVVRGADLLDSTARQILLQQLLDLPTPGYAHIPLVCSADGQKLSKQNHAEAISDTPALHALQRAWKHLNQDVLPVRLTSAAEWLRAASASFELAKIREVIIRRS